MRETIQGQEYTVQYFERARFELHPENQPPFNVLLGLLGNELRDNASGAPSGPPPSPTPMPQPAPLPPPSFNNCQVDPTVAPNYPVQIITVRKDDEVVVLKNMSPDPVSLDGWRMCSIRGNQEYLGIGGSPAPGETKEFPYAGSGNIWNNSDSDPGALYDPEGRLVSYWPN
jgi:micrococcal nuclease